LCVSDIRVSFNELVHLLGWVYRVYYPGKKRLSDEERKEVVEKLVEWYGILDNHHIYFYIRINSQLFIACFIFSSLSFVKVDDGGF
jgi:hypothetical protein